MKVELDKSDVLLLLTMLDYMIDRGCSVEMMREYLRLHDYLKEFV